MEYKWKTQTKNRFTYIIMIHEMNAWPLNHHLVRASHTTELEMFPLLNELLCTACFIWAYSNQPTIATKLFCLLVLAKWKKKRTEKFFFRCAPAIWLSSTAFSLDDHAQMLPIYKFHLIQSVKIMWQTHAVCWMEQHIRMIFWNWPSICVFVAALVTTFIITISW